MFLQLPRENKWKTAVTATLHSQTFNSLQNNNHQHSSHKNSAF